MELRIGYITSQYPRSSDTFIRREVEVLRENGVHVDVMSIRPPPTERGASTEIEEERGRTRYILPCPVLELVRAHAGQIGRSPRTYLSALLLALHVRAPGLRGLLWGIFYFAEAAIVARIVQRERLVHLHNHFCDGSGTVAMLAAHMGGFGFSFTVHGPGEFFTPREICLGEKVRRASFVVCISRFSRSQCMIWSAPEHWDRLHIVHCGVRPELFDPVEPSGEQGRLLYVGRLAAVKGLPILFDAASRLRARGVRVTLTLIGDGPDRASLERRARELGIADAVDFVGTQPEAGVRQWLQKSDVFVLPSFAEGLPVVLMEALASAVPVVATNIAGVGELVVDGESGYLVPPSDSEALAGRIEELVQQPELRRKLGRSGRNKVAMEFDVAREGVRLLELLHGAIASDRGESGPR